MNDDENNHLVGIRDRADSPLPTSFSERFQVDLNPIRRSRTCSLRREGARSSTGRIPVHRVPEITWRSRRNDLAL